MKNKRSLIKQMSLNLLYVIAILLCVVKVGSISTITTYNIAGVSSLGSSQILSEYVEPKEEPQQIVEKKALLTNASSPVGKTYKYRLTSYWENDDCNSVACVGAGFCAQHFQTNSKGWYTYKGKLVVAAATTYLQKQFGTKPNKLYFKYYDELILTIDGVKYEAIVLDTCGACYKNEIIDLFVKDKKSSIDRGYRGYNMITVEVKKKQ